MRRRCWVTILGPFPHQGFRARARPFRRGKLLHFVPTVRKGSWQHCPSWADRSPSCRRGVGLFVLAASQQARLRSKSSGANRRLPWVFWPARQDNVLDRTSATMGGTGASMWEDLWTTWGCLTDKRVKLRSARDIARTLWIGDEGLFVDSMKSQNTLPACCWSVPSLPRLRDCGCRIAVAGHCGLWRWAIQPKIWYSRYAGTGWRARFFVL